MKSTHASLESLRRTPQPPASRPRNATPLLLLLAFLLGIAALFAVLFGDRLRPRTTVTVAPALYLETDGVTPAVSHDTPGPMIAQASGWLEPDPYPVRVAVKVDGFVEAVHVLEGQAVRTGDLLATLDSTNLTLEVTRLKADLTEALADLAVREQEIVAAEAEAKAAEARLAQATDQANRLRALEAGDIAEAERVTAVFAESEAQALLEAARSGVAVRRARMKQQQARINSLQAGLDQAQLNLERCRIVSPMDGIVLKRHAAPGMKRMASMDDPDSATIVTLYDPDHLQMRVDVPLSDAGRIETGMTARLVTAAFANRVFTGVVSRVTGEADLTRNTLQVKVSILEPEPGMRPEMLGRAEFLGSLKHPMHPTGTRMIWIPTAAVLEADGDAASVWVIDPVQETAEYRAITLGLEEKNGLSAVLEGLRAGEKVVTDGADHLKPGALVKMLPGERDGK